MIDTKTKLAILQQQLSMAEQELFRYETAYELQTKLKRKDASTASHNAITDLKKEVSFLEHKIAEISAKE